MPAFAGSQPERWRRSCWPFVYSATSTNGQTDQAATVSYLLEGALLTRSIATPPSCGTDQALTGYGARTCGTLKL